MSLCLYLAPLKLIQYFVLKFYNPFKADVLDWGVSEMLSWQYQTFKHSYADEKKKSCFVAGTVW